MSVYRVRSSTISLSSLFGTFQNRNHRQQHGGANDMDQQKFEISQLNSAQKILTQIETLPKEKHIRNLILGTFHEHGTYFFWTLMASAFQFESNPIICWKFSYLLHRILRDGHVNSISNSFPVISYIEQLGKFWSSLQQQYGLMIERYCNLLHTKLTFHQKHTFFPGNLQINYDELRKAIEGSHDAFFEISADLLDYLDVILEFQLVVFKSLSQYYADASTAVGHCRLLPLVPCIHEANALYDLLVKTLFHMHEVLNPDDLQGHRSRFYQCFQSLKEFYRKSVSLRFIRDFISIPAMPKTAPNFMKIAEFASYKAPVCKFTGHEQIGSPDNACASYESIGSGNSQGSASLFDFEPNAVSTTVTEQSQRPDNVEHNQQNRIAKKMSDPVGRESCSREDLLSLEFSSTSATPALPPPVGNLHAECASQISRMNTELIGKNQAIETLNAKLIVLQAAQSSTRQELTDHMKELTVKSQASEAKYEKMKVMYSKLREQHLTLLQSYAAEKNGNENAAGFIEELTEIKKGNACIQTMEKSNQKVARHAASTQTKANEKPSEEQKESEIALQQELKDRVQLFEETNQKLNNKIQENVKEMEILQAEIKKLTIELKQLQHTLYDKTEKEDKEKEFVTGAMSEEISSVIAEKIKLEEQCKELTSQLTMINKQRSRLSDALHMNRSNFALVKDDKMELEALLLDMVHDRDMTEQRAKDMEDQVKAKDLLIEKLTSDLVEIEYKQELRVRELTRKISDGISEGCQTLVNRVVLSTNSLPSGQDVINVLVTVVENMDSVCMKTESYLQQTTCFEVNVDRLAFSVIKFACSVLQMNKEPAEFWKNRGNVAEKEGYQQASYIANDFLEAIKFENTEKMYSCRIKLIDCLRQRVQALRTLTEIKWTVPQASEIISPEQLDSMLLKVNNLKDTTSNVDDLTTCQQGVDTLKNSISSFTTSYQDDPLSTETSTSISNKICHELAALIGLVVDWGSKDHANINEIIKEYQAHLLSIVDAFSLLHMFASNVNTKDVTLQCIETVYIVCSSLNSSVSNLITRSSSSSSLDAETKSDD